MGINNVLEKT